MTHRGVDRHVRVFTVCNESRYVVVRNVPALGVVDDLLTRLSLYGKVCEYRVLDHADDQAAAIADDNDADDESAGASRGVLSDRDHDDRFTDVVWVQYETVNNARHAKARAGLKPFFGSMLRIAYAPQYETREDALLKLTQRRELLQRRARSALPDTRMRRPQPPSQYPSASVSTAASQRSENKDVDEFIGPQLPPTAAPVRPAIQATPAVSITLPRVQRDPSTTAKRRRI